MFEPGKRVYLNSDKCDTFNVIIKGRVGIFYPDSTRITAINQSQIVYIDEAGALERL